MECLQLPWDIRKLDLVSDISFKSMKSHVALMFRLFFFQEMDFLSCDGELRGFDVCIDKGTFDAITLNPDNFNDGKKLYLQSLRKALKCEGFFVITSCNWTREQLLDRFSEGEENKTHDFFFSVCDLQAYFLHICTNMCILAKLWTGGWFLYTWAKVIPDPQGAWIVNLPGFLGAPDFFSCFTCTFCLCFFAGFELVQELPTPRLQFGGQMGNSVTALIFKRVQ